MKISTMAAVMALSLGASVAMARGPEVSQRIRSFPKGGIELAQAEGTNEKKTEAPAATQPAEKYVCPMGCAESDKPGKCPKCGMTLKKEAAKPSHSHQH